MSDEGLNLSQAGARMAFESWNLAMLDRDRAAGVF